jgi:hypothetical protein
VGILEFRAALLRIRENTRMLQRWQAGELPEGSREWRVGQVLDHMARTGDVPRTRVPSTGAFNVTNHKLLGGRGAERTWGRLFLTRTELTALAVLLTDRFGWNLAVYDRIPAPVHAHEPARHIVERGDREAGLSQPLGENLSFWHESSEPRVSAHR